MGLAAFTHGLPVILFPDRFEFDVKGEKQAFKFKLIFLISKQNKFCVNLILKMGF